VNIFNIEERLHAGREQGGTGHRIFFRRRRRNSRNKWEKSFICVASGRISMKTIHEKEIHSL
jgi:hypothetical protein